jgi:hypothetical protein
MSISKNLRRYFPIFIAISFLAACTLPASYAPNVSENDNLLTQAAGTIAAHLTQGASADIQSTETLEPAATDSQTTPQTFTETLPATSTPLPTNTPPPSATPQPSETPLPSPSPTATRIEDALKAELGDPTWHDSFGNSDNWPIYNNEHVQMSIRNSKLEMVALNADKWESWMVTWDEVKNFYLEINAQAENCGGLDRYGMLIRSNKAASQAYLYGITCDGRYSLRVWDGESFSSLIGWTESDVINTGNNSSNRVGFKAETDTLSLYANGEMIDQVKDDTFSEGAFGLFIGSVNTPVFRVRFEDISLWILPE